MVIVIHVFDVFFLLLISCCVLSSITLL